MRSTLGTLGDRVNPVLVKEVRQSLRGNQFKISFWFTVSAATLIGVFVMLVHAVDGGLDSLGPSFTMAMFGCMCAALLLFVPVMSFFSMGAEWDENTYDLLVLSDLRPRRIVGGKLLAAALQTVLFLSAFGPYLVFAFLLRGVDLVGVVVSIGLCVAGSLGLSAVAICMSSLTSVRFARVVLLVALVAACVGAGGALMGVTAAMQFENVLDLSNPEQRAGLAAAFVGAAIVGAFAFSVACARLAHSEENRSTGLRVLATVGLLVALAWVAWLYDQVWDGEVLSAMTCALLAYVAAAGLFFATEDEVLGRRVALHVPRRAPLALLATPFLPGGGRGALWALAMAALVPAGILATYHFSDVVTSQTLAEDGGWAAAVFGLYVIVYLFLPTAALSAYTGALLGRILVRVAVVLFVLIATFVPVVLGFFLRDPTLMEMKHPGHPFWIMSEVWDGDLGLLQAGPMLVVAGLAGLSLLANAPRLFVGLREVLAASHARRTAAPAPAEVAARDAVPES